MPSLAIFLHTSGSFGKVPIQLADTSEYGHLQECYNTNQTDSSNASECNDAMEWVDLKKSPDGAPMKAYVFNSSLVHPETTTVSDLFSQVTITMYINCTFYPSQETAG